jgi:hypothetical protein
MSTQNVSDEEDLVHCYECGAEIRRSAEICKECGVRQQSAPPSSSGHTVDDPTSTETDDTQSTDFLAEYSILQWIVAAIVGLVTFPVGLLVPAYLFYKASNGSGKEQSGLESWTAILFGILGIIGVEIGGKTAAKALWGLFTLLIAVSVAIIVAG